MTKNYSFQKDATLATATESHKTDWDKIADRPKMTTAEIIQSRKEWDAAFVRGLDTVQFD